MPAPARASMSIDKRSGGHLYADHALGRSLKKILPARNKALFDQSCLAAITNPHLRLAWIRQSQTILAGSAQEKLPLACHRWSHERACHTSDRPRGDADGHLQYHERQEVTAHRLLRTNCKWCPDSSKDSKK